VDNAQNHSGNPLGGLRRAYPMFVNGGTAYSNVLLNIMKKKYVSKECFVFINVLTGGNRISSNISKDEKA